MRTTHLVNIIWFKLLLGGKVFVNTITVHSILSKLGRLVVRLPNLLARSCVGEPDEICARVLPGSHTLSLLEVGT